MDANSTPVLQGGHTGGFKLDEAGYYLIVDTSSFSSSADGDSYHAYNSFLLKVNKDHYHVQITPKVVKPTVEKKVYDNDDKALLVTITVGAVPLTMRSTKSSSSS